MQRPSDSIIALPFIKITLGSFRSYLGAVLEEFPRSLKYIYLLLQPTVIDQECTIPSTLIKYVIIIQYV